MQRQDKAFLRDCHLWRIVLVFRDLPQLMKKIRQIDKSGKTLIYFYFFHKIYAIFQLYMEFLGWYA